MTRDDWKKLMYGEGAATALQQNADGTYTKIEDEPPLVYRGRVTMLSETQTVVDRSPCPICFDRECNGEGLGE